jgi:hypothetical protein
VINVAIPDITAGMIRYLKGKTIAGDAVMEVQGRSSRAPYLLVIWDGDIEQLDTRVPRARITVEAWGGTVVRARYLARQAREAIIPPANVTYGVHAVVVYFDKQEDQNKAITLSGARLESGPREGPDQRDRIITTYLVDYY